MHEIWRESPLFSHNVYIGREIFTRFDEICSVMMFMMTGTYARDL